MGWLWVIVPTILVILGVLAYRATTPGFVMALVKEGVMLMLPSFLRVFENTPKTPEEWKLQRDTMSDDKDARRKAIAEVKRRKAATTVNGK